MDNSIIVSTFPSYIDGKYAVRLYNSRGKNFSKDQCVIPLGFEGKGDSDSDNVQFDITRLGTGIYSFRKDGKNEQVELVDVPEYINIGVYQRNQALHYVVDNALDTTVNGCSEQNGYCFVQITTGEKDFFVTKVINCFDARVYVVVKSVDKAFKIYADGSWTETMVCVPSGYYQDCSDAYDQYTFNLSDVDVDLHELGFFNNPSVSPLNARDLMDNGPYEIASGVYLVCTDKKGKKYLLRHEYNMKLCFTIQHEQVVLPVVTYGKDMKGVVYDEDGNPYVEIQMQGFDDGNYEASPEYIATLISSAGYAMPVKKIETEVIFNSNKDPILDVRDVINSLHSVSVTQPKKKFLSLGDEKVKHVAKVSDRDLLLCGYVPGPVYFSLEYRLGNKVKGPHQLPLVDFVNFNMVFNDKSWDHLQVILSDYALPIFFKSQTLETAVLVRFRSFVAHVLELIRSGLISWDPAGAIAVKNLFVSQAWVRSGKISEEFNGLRRKLRVRKDLIASSKWLYHLMWVKIGSMGNQDLLRRLRRINIRCPQLPVKMRMMIQHYNKVNEDAFDVDVKKLD
jgi:hypothetical protein